MILPLRTDTAAADGDPGNVGLERRRGKLIAAVSGSEACGDERTRNVRRRCTTAGWGGSRNVSAIESLSTKTDIVEPRGVHSKGGGIWASPDRRTRCRPNLPESCSGTQQAVSD